MRKRKVTYPVARTATKQPRNAGLPGDPGYVRSTVATINLAALDVRDDLKVGHRVKIGGGGLYAGEFAVVESILSGIIPAAMVRTEAGKTRRVRSVDRYHDPPLRRPRARRDRKAGGADCADCACRAR